MTSFIPDPVALMPANRSRSAVETVITTHINPDYDAVASMVAASKIYPEAVMVFPGGQGKNIRNYFIQSLLYLFNVAKPRELDFSGVRRLVVVDTRRPERLGLAAEVLKNPGLDIHLYDHHPDAEDDLVGSLNVVDQVGANSTLMTEILVERGLLLNPQEATMLALGLYEDTGAFTFSSTTARDLKAGAILLGSGADLSVVAELTSRELTPQQLSLLNELILNAETREARSQSLVITTARREVYVDDLAVLAHKMMDMMGLNHLFILVEMKNMVQLVARSRQGNVDVAEIARAFGGGGHSMAAAAVIRGQDLGEARLSLEKILNETLGRFFRAGHIMTHPVVSINVEKTLMEARELMARFSLNVILVEDKEKTIGYLTEHSVSKAMYHGLVGFLVSDLMLSEFKTVGPEASFSEVKNIVLDLKQRILPVVDSTGHTLGVITRSDLVQLLADEAGWDRGTKWPTYERNLIGLMRDRMPQPLMELLRELGRLADDNGTSLYLVGGSVRDLIMLKPIHDLDLTLTGDVTTLAQAFISRHPDVKVKDHPRFKTATLIMADGYRLDLSSARLEYYEYPGALPVVDHGSIQLDLHRRDFTINALAMSLNTDDFGHMLDFFRGYHDIRDGLIRVLHSLSFVEDPTRAFRAVRFENRLGFKISQMTVGLLENAVSGDFFKKLHPRRLMTELKLVCEESEPGPALARLGELGLLAVIHPDLRVTPPQRELFRKVAMVMDWFRLTFSERFAPIWLVYFLALTEELVQEDLEILVGNMESSKKLARAVVAERPKLLVVLGQVRRYKSLDSLKPSQADRLYGGLTWPGILYIMAKTNGSSLARAGASYLTTYRRVRAQCTGDDLLALGLKAGPQLQKVLMALRSARLDGLVSNLEEEKKQVVSWLSDSSGPLTVKNKDAG